MNWLTDWTTPWEIWAIIGLVLVITEMLDGSGFLIALGVAAFLMAALAVVSMYAGVELIPNWKVAVVEFAGFAVGSIFVVRKLRASRTGPSDPNEY